MLCVIRNSGAQSQHDVSLMFTQYLAGHGPNVTSIEY